jgi:hypothetical protein
MVRAPKASYVFFTPARLMTARSCSVCPGRFDSARRAQLEERATFRLLGQVLNFEFPSPGTINVRTCKGWFSLGVCIPPVACMYRLCRLLLYGRISIPLSSPDEMHMTGVILYS